MPTLVEIGPSNASQGQHRRKKGSNEIIEKIDTRQESNPGPCVSGAGALPLRHYLNYLNTLSKNSMSRICPQEGKSSEVSLRR